MESGYWIDETNISQIETVGYCVDERSLC